MIYTANSIIPYEIVKTYVTFVKISLTKGAKYV
jgi:hypothetical protein